MFSKYNVSSRTGLLGLLLLTFFNNSNGIKVNNEYEAKSTKTKNIFSFNPYSYKEIDIQPNLTTSEKAVASSLITNGSLAAVGQFPYQASLRTPGGEHFCDGSIISNKWIFTSAYCVFRKSSTDIVVVVGSNYLNSGGRAYKVNRIFILDEHVQYSALDNVAVIEGIGSIALTDTVKKINLASLPPLIWTHSGLSNRRSTSYPSENQHSNLPYIQLVTLAI